MTRVKLKEYQDSYAEAMSKFGLNRGIVGSEARHVTTQEFYRNAIAQQADLQDNIEELLKVEELKRESVTELKQQEHEARARTELATTEKQETEIELASRQSELQKIKGELKTEKFKNSAAEAGSAIMDGLSSVLGTSKVKRQQQEIVSLKDDNHSLRQEISSLNQTMNSERLEHNKTTDELKSELNKIYDWLPDIKQLVKLGDHCIKIGFSSTQTKDLLNMRSIRFTGELYSHEYARHFKADNSEVRIERDGKNPNLFNLLIDRINIIHWFRLKYREFQERLGIKIPERKQHEIKI